MSPDGPVSLFRRVIRAAAAWTERFPVVPRMIVLASTIGVFGGYGAVLFTLLMEVVAQICIEPLLAVQSSWGGRIALSLVPAFGMLAVAWITRHFAPEAEGHGVPEVITAVARKDGIIRPRVAIVKILASGLCIGTGGSVGREGPIVLIGSSLGSMAGQWCRLPPRQIKVLVAAGAAAGISATFNAPLAGVIFACEIILGTFAVESLTPIVVASVVADVVQKHIGEHGQHPAFTQLEYHYEGAVAQLPIYVLLGLFCGVLAVGFTKTLYAVEDLGERWLPSWWVRALVLGGIVGVIATLYPTHPPVESASGRSDVHPVPALLGVGYPTVDHALHLQSKEGSAVAPLSGETEQKSVRLQSRKVLLAELCWLLPLALLKPLLTSLTLAGGGSGGVFAPSLFIGATGGASFGLLCNLIAPEISANPGVYAIVGMGAVVAGTTHGVMSAILIVYEMTDNYQIILPIMAAAGLSSTLAQFIDRESIYYKKLSRRGETIARGHDMHCLEHIMVRDVMVRDFPSVSHSANATEIVRIARQNAHLETLPVMGDQNRLVGIIRPEDLHRVLDTDVAHHLITAEDIAIAPPLAVSLDANLLEALRDFGRSDVETLPVEAGEHPRRRLVGLLHRVDVMRRYRMELLAQTN